VPRAATRWSIVHAQDADPVRGRAALGDLCAAYWPPVYVWARRRGDAPELAEARVQHFFAAVLDDHAAADHDRCRRWLLAALREHDGQTIEPTQAPAASVPFDAALAERIHAALDTDALSAEEAYERAWARSVLGHALARVRADYAAAGKQAELETLAPTVLQGARVSHATIAARLGTNEAAVEAAVTRLRTRYGELLRDEVADTVVQGGDVEDELQTLLVSVRARAPSRA